MIIAEKLERFRVTYCSPNECEFHDVDSHILVKTVIQGSTFCAFFDKKLCDVESIKRCRLIKVHNIYPCDFSEDDDDEF